MAVATMTELNRHPARLARLAEREDVIITERGVPRLRLVRVDPPSTAQRLVDLGLLTPPRSPGTIPRRPSLTREQAAEAIAQWEAERDAEW